MANAITLKVYEGGKLTTTRSFQSEQIRLGSAGADLVLDMPGVEPSHAIIEAGAVPVIRGVNNAPVYLNGQPIIAAPLRHGDLISIGEVRVMVELRATVPAPAPAAAAAAARPRLQLIQNEEGPSRDASHPSFAVVRESDPGPRLVSPLLLGELRAAPDAKGARVEARSELSDLSVPAHADALPAPRMQPAPEAAIAPARPLPPFLSTAPIGGECVEVELFWADTRISVWQLAPGEQFVAGGAEGCDALLEGIDRATVVRSDANGWTISAPRPLSLSLIEDSRVLGGPELLVRGRSQADAHGLVVQLPARAVAVLVSGALSLRVRRVPSAARAGTEPQDWKGALGASVAAVLLVGLMKVFGNIVPPPAPLSVGEIIRPRPLAVRSAVKPPDPLDPEHNKAAQARKDPGEAVARHQGAEGEAGSKTAPRRAARAERTRDEKAIVAQSGLLKGLGMTKGASDVFGVALQKGARDAMGHLTGPRVADARGDGGMGLRSLGGAGGGGDGTGLGLARIGTNGIGGGLANYGSGQGGLKGKSDADIGLGPGQPQVSGHIDPELIRKVVHDHRAQIRTCYESQLTARPGLAGKLISAWTIDQSGAVTEAHTQESSLKDHTVESCVASKIKTWRFPIPKGGGEVFVTYPFIFTPGG